MTEKWKYFQYVSKLWLSKVDMSYDVCCNNLSQFVIFLTLYSRPQNEKCLLWWSSLFSVLYLLNDKDDDQKDTNSFLMIARMQIIASCLRNDMVNKFCAYHLHYISSPSSSKDFTTNYITFMTYIYISIFSVVINLCFIYSLSWNLAIHDCGKITEASSCYIPFTILSLTQC